MLVSGSRGESDTFSGPATGDVAQKTKKDLQNSNKECADLLKNPTLNGAIVTTNNPLSLHLGIRDLNSFPPAAPGTLPRKVINKKLPNSEHLKPQIAEDLVAASAEINENVCPDASPDASPKKRGGSGISSSFHWVVDEDDDGIIVLNANFSDSDHEKLVNGDVYFSKPAFVERHRPKCGQRENTAAFENFIQVPLEPFRADSPAFGDAPEMENAVDTDFSESDQDSPGDPFIDIEADQQFLELNSPDVRHECVASCRSKFDNVNDPVSWWDYTTEDHDDSVASGEDSSPEPDANARSENLVKTLELTDFDAYVPADSPANPVSQTINPYVVTERPETRSLTSSLCHDSGQHSSSGAAQDSFAQVGQAVTEPCSHNVFKSKADFIPNSHEQKIPLSPNHEHENSNRERKNHISRVKKSAELQVAGVRPEQYPASQHTLHVVLRTRKGFDQSQQSQEIENQSVLPYSGCTFGELPWWEDSWHKGPQDGRYFKEASQLRYRPSSELRSRLRLEVMPEVNDSICQSSKL